MIHKLIVFISSTADLKGHRDAIESTLENLDINGSRFEAWPPVPDSDGGMGECLRRVDEADAVILLLGGKYGTIVEGGLSATHQEYRHAIAKKKPVFPFVLRSDDREELQERFVEEVQGHQFRGRVVETIDELTRTAREALLQEYTRCFRHTHGGPPALAALQKTSALPSVATSLLLSDEPETALRTLAALYERGGDRTIQRLAPQIALKFGNHPQIANFMYMAEVNLGMHGEAVDAERIKQAIEFWDDPSLRNLTTDYSLAYCQGNALGVLERHQEAIARYEFAVSKEPRFAPCWKNLGTAYVSVGDQAAAKRCFLRAVEIEPQLFEARYSLATLAIDSEGFQEALDHLGQIAVDALPPMQQSWVFGLKAKCQGRLGLHGEAIRMIEDAIAIAPDSEWPWFWAARIYAVARRADKQWLPASRAFGERMVCRFPDNGEIWGELGYTYWQLRRTEPTPQLSNQAVHAFSKAVELGVTENGLIPDRLGHLYMDAGAFEKAEAAFRTAASTDAASYGYCLGCSLMKLERFADALEWLIAAAEKHQSDALAWCQVGFCHDKMGDRKNAIKAFERAIQCDSEDAVAWFNLGGMLWNDGQRLRAIEVLGKALSRFPDHELAANAKMLLA